MCNNRRPPPQPRPKEKDPAAATSARQSPQRSHEAPRSHTKTKQAGRNLLDPRRLFAGAESGKVRGCCALHDPKVTV